MILNQKNQESLVLKKLRNVAVFSCFVVFSFLFLFVSGASAQIETPLSIKSSSNTPRPGQTITLTAETFSLNLQGALLTWRVNNTEYATGVGKNSITITLGNAGTPTDVSVIATHVSGTTARASRRLIPTEVILVWEAQTYTPPLYKGKALFTAGSSVRFIALPNIVENGRRYSSDELIFTWKDNGKVLGSQSGLGRNTFVLKGSPLGRDMQVTVEVTNPTETVLARSIVRIERADPEILLYERTPLSGIRFNEALTKTFQLEEREVSLEAYPYFFSTQNRNASQLRYTWRVANESITPANRVSAITLRRGEGRGTVSVLLSVDNVRDILQRTAGALTVHIGSVE